MCARKNCYELSVPHILNEVRLVLRLGLATVTLVVHLIVLPIALNVVGASASDRIDKVQVVTARQVTVSQQANCVVRPPAVEWQQCMIWWWFLATRTASRTGRTLFHGSKPRGSSVAECRTRNQVSPGSNPPLLPFRTLGIFVLSIDAPVQSAV